MTSSDIGDQYSFKIIVIGDSGTGKTSLSSRFTNQTFIQQQPTVGVDLNEKTIKIGDDTVKLLIWDTAGQDRFRQMTHQYYRAAVGLILVYDITSLETFTNLNRWIQDAKSEIGDSLNNTVSCIIGNKVDLENSREVPTLKGQEYAKKNGMLFIETSAKSSYNVSAAFEQLCLTIYQNKTIRDLCLVTNDSKETGQRKGKRKRKADDYEEEVIDLEENSFWSFQWANNFLQKFSC
ncbi:MAG: putative GTP-binding protein ypt3 [Streblomastix strix]|uniref:Putative GTP-binding protein ypt3 n=1 Tax=Streblomastix strix TaxID=222440 RepID=A0A5J4W518_9EUKA|nr:MAG: putative GTP-binding protein ypt3 [Streblomastix strix]